MDCIDDQILGAISIQVSKRGPGGVFACTIHAVSAGHLFELPATFI